MENDNETQRFPVVNTEIFNTTATSPNKTNSGFPNLKIIIAVIIILLGIIFFILGIKNIKNDTNKKYISNQVKIHTIQKNVSLIGKGKYGWNYYKDLKTSISFSYPEDWKLTVSKNKFDITKDNYHIKIGIGIGDSPIYTIAAKQETILLFNKTLSSVYSNSRNNECTSYSGKAPSVNPISAVCLNSFDTIFLTNTNCFNGSICSGGTWPMTFEWSFTPKPPLTIGIYITFSSPNLIPSSDSNSNPYIIIFNKFISTITLPPSISSSIL